MRLGLRVSSSKQSTILHFSPLSGFVVSTSGRKITHDGDKGHAEVDTPAAVTGAMGECVAPPRGQRRDALDVTDGILLRGSRNAAGDRSPAQPARSRSTGHRRHDEWGVSAKER
ncbi:hypothetical protein HPB47_019051 [Ixodes persulcatus]|uniref:Uncharacterized protein n=1 Tax=Ixodes persulcatus TaxID=34615 RepID=A0AC60QZN3_IXOPE|nr:hypothetical protein HPB47_019051 [Ixodes persulcatus]